MLLTALVALTLAAVPAGAQDVKIETKPPEPTRERIIVPGPQLETTRPPDADVYPQGTKVTHDPAFVAPLSTETDRGRAGVSGWTAPNQPVGSQVTGFSEVSGWFALGLSFTWGGPPVPRY